jgi:hypothetical protein
MQVVSCWRLSTCVIRSEKVLLTHSLFPLPTPTFQTRNVGHPLGRGTLEID